MTFDSVILESVEIKSVIVVDRLPTSMSSSYGLITPMLKIFGIFDPIRCRVFALVAAGRRQLLYGKMPRKVGQFPYRLVSM